MVEVLLAYYAICALVFGACGWLATRGRPVFARVMIVTLLLFCWPILVPFGAMAAIADMFKEKDG